MFTRACYEPYICKLWTYKRAQCLVQNMLKGLSRFSETKLIKFDILNMTDFKDARSVSLNPYNRLQILQYDKYTK